MFRFPTLGQAVHPLEQAAGRALHPLEQLALDAYRRNRDAHTMQFIRSHPGSMEAEYYRWNQAHPNPTRADRYPIDHAVLEWMPLQVAHAVQNPMSALYRDLIAGFHTLQPQGRPPERRP